MPVATEMFQEILPTVKFYYDVLFIWLFTIQIKSIISPSDTIEHSECAVRFRFIKTNSPRSKDTAQHQNARSGRTLLYAPPPAPVARPIAIYRRAAARPMRRGTLEGTIRNLLSDSRILHREPRLGR